MNLRNAVGGWRLNGIDLEATSIAANAVGASEISTAAVTNAKLGTNAVTAAKISALTVTGAKLSAGCIIKAKLGTAAVGNAAMSAAAVKAAAISALTITGAKMSAGCIVATKLAANAVTGAAISAGTIANADLSSPESYLQQSARIDKVAANQAAASRAYLGRLPAAAILVKTWGTASTINNVALTTPPMCCWVTNGTSRLNTGSGLVIPSTAFRAVSAALSTASINQAAGKDIYVSAKTSTQTSGLGVYVHALWKLAHTT